ncbi:MAG: lysylphosphatidylglycerol synthase transmembrane domain-containing protein [Bacteroidota bacterium]
MRELVHFIQQKSSLFFLCVGLGILTALLYYLDFSVIADSFNIIGNKIFLVFAVSVLWIVCNTMCISILLGHRISFYQLLYNQVTGDGYNVITPFAGLGGEPYKIKHLTNWISLDEASEAIMRDRLIHSLSGMLYSCLTLWTVILFVPLEKGFLITFIVFGVILAVLSILLSLIILSDKPNKFLGQLMKKMKLLEEFKSNPLRRSIFLKALGYKLLGRVLNMLEFLVIFLLLGITPGVLEIVTISAMLALSGTFLFIIPQGIGVNEAGISGAFQLIGRPVELGLGVGLIRRARVLFWALFGIALHLSVLLYRNLYLKKQREKN